MVCYITELKGRTAWKRTNEKLKKTSVYLEEEVLEALEEAALELEKETGMKWSKGAVIRLALSDFFTRRGKML